MRSSSLTNSSGECAPRSGPTGWSWWSMPIADPESHGTPPALLKCEFAAVGYAPVEMHEMPSVGGYLATFRAVGPRPEPDAIKPCRID